MGEAAVVMQEYLGDAYRFADLFNVVFFQGEQVIEPQMLSEQSERYAEGGEATDEKDPGTENIGKNTGM